MKRTKTIYFIGIIVSIFLTKSFTKPKSESKMLVEISKEYKSYSLYHNYLEKVADSVAYKRFMNWTISLCINTPQKYPFGEHGYTIEKDSFYISKTKLEQSQHGNKLYKLYVKDLQSYIHKQKEQPLGQVLIKETWNVKVIDSSDIKYALKVRSKNDNLWYTPTTVSQLFIMYKEQKSDKNDEGWKYGIVDIETKKTKVLSQGKISNCIGCHKNTKYDRIFGAN